MRFSGRTLASQSVVVQTPQSVPPVVIAEAEPAFPDFQPVTATNKRVWVRAAAAGGAIAALVSIIPLGSVIAIPLSGLLAVLFYRKWSHNGELPSSAGFRLGAIGGLFGFVILTIVKTMEVLATHQETMFRDLIIQSIQAQEARNPDPQARQVLEYFLTPHGIAVMMVFGLIFTCIIFVLLAGLGGSISATLFRRRPPHP